MNRKPELKLHPKARVNDAVRKAVVQAGGSAKPTKLTFSDSRVSSANSKTSRGTRDTVELAGQLAAAQTVMASQACSIL